MSIHCLYYNFFAQSFNINQKITAKNAFALHLIDYMADVVKNQGGATNFQVSSIIAVILLEIIFIEISFIFVIMLGDTVA